MIRPSLNKTETSLLDNLQFGNRELICMIWYTCLFFLGVPINGVAIFTLATLRKTRLDQYWILLLSTTDFLFAWTNGVAKALRLLLSMLNYDSHMTSGVGCLFFGSLNYICFGTTTLILEAIAIDRCLIIVKQAAYTSFTARNRSRLVGASYFVIIMFPTVAISLPLLGIGGRVLFDPSQLTCSLESTSYKFIAFGLFIFFPLVVMIFMYSAILFYFFQHQNRVGTIPAASVQQQNPQGRWKLPKINSGDIRLIETMIITVLAYCVCLLPYTLFSLLRVKSLMALSLGTAFAYSTVIANPCTYFIINRNMRQAVRLAFRCKRYSMNQERPITRSSQATY